MQTIDTKDLEAMMDDEQEFLLLNVLSEEDFERAHIPGSENLPVDRPDFVEQAEDMAGSKDATVVVYCSSSDCDASVEAARMLEEAGFNKDLHYDVGMKGWLQDGHEVERAAAD